MIEMQESEDNEDLGELKGKLSALENQEEPWNKDEIIEYMMARLNVAEDAIQTCEGIIQHERDNCRIISDELNEKNASLRQLIEPEKLHSLNDKVDNQIEVHLEDAVRDRLKLKKEYDVTLRQLKETTSELDKVND